MTGPTGRSLTVGDPERRTAKRPSFIRRFARHRAGLAGAVVFGLFVLAGVFAQLIAPYDPIDAKIQLARQAPSSLYWLGTDELGRDVLSRLIYGAGLSLRVGALAVGVGVLLGVPLGTISGYFGGAADLVAQRFIDTLQAFPGILLALLAGAVAGPNLDLTIAVLGVLSVPVYTRLMRGSVMVVKELAYIESSRAIGCSTRRILLLHVLPNAISPALVQVSLQFGTSILLLAGLGYLGLGAQPPTPEWGAMLSQGRVYMRSAPHLVLFPGAVISLVVLSLNLMGDAFRDALDPRTLATGKR